MPFEKDPNELGSIFVSAGKGNYADTTFFGGRAFEIPDGTYRIENKQGTSKKTGQPYHLLVVTRVESDAHSVEDELRRAHEAIDNAPPF